MKKGILVLLGLVLLTLSAYGQPVPAAQSTFDIVGDGTYAWVANGREQMPFQGRGHLLGVTYDQSQNIVLDVGKQWIGQTAAAGYTYFGLFNSNNYVDGTGAPAGKDFLGCFFDGYATNYQYTSLYFVNSAGSGASMGNTVFSKPVPHAATEGVDCVFRLTWDAAAHVLQITEYYGTTPGGVVMYTGSKTAKSPTYDVNFNVNMIAWFDEGGGNTVPPDYSDYSSGHWYNSENIWACNFVQLTVGSTLVLDEGFGTAAAAKAFFNFNSGSDGTVYADPSADWGWPACTLVTNLASGSLNGFVGKSGLGPFEPNNYKFTQPGAMVLKVRKGNSGSYGGAWGRNFRFASANQSVSRALEADIKLYANEAGAGDLFGFFPYGPSGNSDIGAVPYYCADPFYKTIHVFHDSTGNVAAGGAGTIKMIPQQRWIGTSSDKFAFAGVAPWNMVAGTQYMMRIGFDNLALGGPALWYQVFTPNAAGTLVRQASMTLPAGATFNIAGGYGGGAGFNDSATDAAATKIRVYIIDAVRFYTQWTGPEVGTWEMY